MRFLPNILPLNGPIGISFNCLTILLILVAPQWGKTMLISHLQHRNKAERWKIHVGTLLSVLCLLSGFEGLELANEKHEIYWFRWELAKSLEVVRSLTSTEIHEIWPRGILFKVLHRKHRNETGLPKSYFSTPNIVPFLLPKRLLCFKMPHKLSFFSFLLSTFVLTNHQF